MYGGEPPRGRRPRGAPGASAPAAMGRSFLLALIFSILLYSGTESSTSPSSQEITNPNEDLEENLIIEDQSTTNSSKNISNTTPYLPAVSLTTPDHTHPHSSIVQDPLPTDKVLSNLLDSDLHSTTKGDPIPNYDLRGYSQGFENEDDATIAQILNELKVTATPSKGPLVWGEVGRGFVAAGSGDERGDAFSPGRLPALLTPSLGSRGRTRSGPYFEEDSPIANVTAPAGTTILLDCRVAMLHDKVVTWAARRADRLQLLTVGKQPYSADKRVALSFKYPNNWRLRIQGAKRSDQGLYECQVAAHPPIIRQIYLTVISPEVNIFDESGRSVVERYYKSGSFLQLTCSAVQLLEPPSMLTWWQGNNVLTEGTNCNVTGPDSATCMLVVEQVTRSHAGTYTCGTPALQTAAALDPAAAPAPTSLAAGMVYSANATVAVHVLHGNLIGVAVLPNTGKSIGAKWGSYISVQELVLGITAALIIQGR